MGLQVNREADLAWPGFCSAGTPKRCLDEATNVVAAGAVQPRRIHLAGTDARHKFIRSEPP